MDKFTHFKNCRQALYAAGALNGYDECGEADTVQDHYNRLSIRVSSTDHTERDELALGALGAAINEGYGEMLVYK